MAPGGNNCKYFHDNRLTKFSAVLTMKAHWGQNDWLLNELAVAPFGHR